MNRKLIYKGKQIKEMTKSELEEQYRINKNRLKIRISFFAIISIISYCIMPLLSIYPLAILGVTTYWILENNEKLIEEIEKRQYI